MNIETSSPGRQEPYDGQFFASQRGGSISSAKVIVPLVLETFPSASVVDVGCGVGGWVAEYMRHGVERVLGVDGDYVDLASLEIPADRFQSADLSRPLDLGSFDLAMSLEVAEHLPEDCAETFVDTLTKAAPIVVFSAAVPEQGGVNHVNEQWPSYWIRKFAARGYVVEDCIRPAIWNDERVKWWYRQNIFVFRRQTGTATPETAVSPEILDCIHPVAWNEARRSSAAQFPNSIKGAMREMAASFVHQGRLASLIARRIAARVSAKAAR